MVAQCIDQVLGQVDASKAGGDDESMIETLQGQVDMLEQTISNMKECQICFNPFDNGTRVPAKGKCQHALYCMACLRELVKKEAKKAKCPTCREPLKGDDLVPLKLNYI